MQLNDLRNREKQKTENGNQRIINGANMGKKEE